jgi:hypothetical protein
MPDTLMVKYAPIDKFVPCKQNKKLWGKHRQENPQLTEFIRESGDIDPLLVCKNGNKLEILSGESRYHSAIALKITQLPYKQIEVIDLKDKLKHVVIRNLGHACSNGKAVRAVTQYLLMTGPSMTGSEIADPRVDDVPEPVEPIESIKQRVQEIIEALKFENSEKWVREVTRLYLRAIDKQNINRIIDGASKAVDESGLDGLEASNNKADVKIGIQRERPSEEEGEDDSAHRGATSSGDINTTTPSLQYESLLQENETLRKKAREDKEYGDSQGQVINTIEQALWKFCEDAHMAARKLGKDVMPTVPSFKIETLMIELGLKSYIHPEQEELSATFGAEDF